MGYLTAYTLSITNISGPERVSALSYAAAELGVFEEDYRHGAAKNKLETDDIKWYEHESDMKSVSFRLPGVRLRLHGEGEDQGDVWVKEFQDGEMFEFMKDSERLAAYDALARQFIEKVDSGLALSTRTYGEFKRILEGRKS